MDDIHILIIPGSLRSDSLNATLAAFASRQAHVLGLKTTLMDLRRLRLPIYDGDLEASTGVPKEALQLQQAIAGCDAVLVVTPEYNGFPTPLVINAFDWLSRITATESQTAGLSTTANKPVALMSASPGPGGALRSMNFLRQYLQMAFQMIVVPQQFALGRAHEAFDEAGELKDARSVQSVKTVLTAVAALAGALRAARQAEQH
ncbi:MAG: NAD(P)H-dependent oxidoreductase [Burkholderiaceae bacterium]|nr:NAD(P)H-dependent oxidoreductase [Burkholderiaceae bacterium]